MGEGRDEVTEALRDEGVDASRLWFRGTESWREICRVLNGGTGGVP